MHAQRLFRPVVPIMLASLVYPALARAQPDETPPGQSADAPDVSAYAGGVAVILLEVPDEWSTGIEPGMIEGMATAGVEGGMSYGAVVDALSEQPELINCDSKRCLTRAAEALGVEWFIKIRVAADELSLDLTLELWNTEDSRKTVSSKCTPCSQGQLTEAITQGIVDLFKPPEEVPIEITSDPTGAALTIDDQEAGLTPYNGKQTPGMHTIQATYPGFSPEREQITVEEKAKVGDGVQRFSLVLGPAPIVKVPDRPFAILKWIGVGASLGAMATGGFWLYIDGKGTCGLFTDEVCKEIYNTNTQGLAVLGGGVALGVATALMFWSDSKTMAKYKRDKTMTMVPVVVPTRGGAVARFQLNF